MTTDTETLLALAEKLEAAGVTQAEMAAVTTMHWETRDVYAGRAATLLNVAAALRALAGRAS